MKITRSQLKQLIAEELNVGVPTASMEESGGYELVQNPVGRPEPEQVPDMMVDESIALELHISTGQWLATPEGTITPSMTLSELIEKMKRFGPEQRFTDNASHGGVLRGDGMSRDTAIGLLEIYRDTMINMLS
jgi:hypothetical protein